MTTNAQHIHAWTIEESNGPTSLGMCRCGTTKVFENSIPGSGNWVANKNTMPPLSEANDEWYREVGR